MNPLNGYPNTPPAFFGRCYELDVVLELAGPRNDKRSAVVLVEGPGGIGKTMLMHRAMAEICTRFPSVRCVGPLDMDDTDYRVASNTGMSIAKTLSERRFARYLEANQRYLELEAGKLDYDTVRFHMAMGDRYFITDYVAYARSHRVVIFIDTVEAIRGTHIWAYFLRMMAALPNTLFVLAGRPQSQLFGSTESFDAELERFRRMNHIGDVNVKHIVLAGWPELDARQFVLETEMGRRLPAPDLEKLLHLSRCHPLHLTLALELPRPRRFAALERMSDADLKEIPLYSWETDTALEVNRTIPPDVKLTDLSGRGKELVQAFERELLLHLAGADPMAQTMRRLAHVRRRLDESMYQEVLNFQPAIITAPTWKLLCNQPWIRRRADNHISVHDIVSELIRHYIWPVRDPNGSERRQLSRDCVKLYDSLLHEQASALERLTDYHNQLRQQDNGLLGYSDQVISGAVRDSSTIQLNKTFQTILETTRKKWVLEAERLYYLLDADLHRGYQDFVQSFDHASNDGQLIVREMILSEMEGFAGRFSDQSDERYQIGLRQIDAAIDENLLAKARSTVELLRYHEKDGIKRYELLNRLGNITLRTPGEIEEGIRYFEQAVVLATGNEKLADKRGHALRELGWSYRQLGRWHEAADKYRLALVGTNLRERKTRAQILRNLAYVESLNGNYDEAKYFIDSSLAVRRAQDDPINLGLDLSVLGEMHRYQRQFAQAHAAYDEAIGLFSEVGASGWLGLVQQEKAICLIQENTEQNVVDEAENHIASALYLCREFSPRNYPSALNRAGRIYVAGIENKLSGGRTLGDYSRAFEAFQQGMYEARRVEDNWFEIANAIEYAELALRLWDKSGSSGHQERIFAHQHVIESKQDDAHLGFPDLFGRWHLVKGHVAWRKGIQVRKSEIEKAVEYWDTALDEYATGFSLIARGYFGSHGVRAVPRESRKLLEHVLKLPKKVALQWCETLEERWGKDEGKSVLLLALVENIYSEVDRRRR